MPRNSIMRPPSAPVLPMMHPNQVEIISKDKRPDDKFSVSSDVVMITPKSVIKKPRSAKSSPRGKRGNILKRFHVHISLLLLCYTVFNYII